MSRPIEYLEWHRANATGRRFDLSTSDQHAVAADNTVHAADTTVDATDATATASIGGETDGASDPVVPPMLAGLSAPDDDASLEAQLAAAYGVDPEQVLVTAGASHANLAAFAAARDDGDRVVVESPGYEPLVATPEWLGMTVGRFDRPAERDFAIEPGAVEAALDRETALAVVTNRHNPSGRRVDPATLAAAAEVAGEHGARLLVDEVYAPFGADPVDGPFGGPSAAGLPGTVVTGSLTKFFGLGDLRVGWLVADAAFVERARTVLHHVPTISATTVALGERALAHRDAIAARAREQVRANHDLLAGFVDGHDDLTGPVFDGATFGLLAHADADGDAVAEAAAAEDLVVVPGRFFDAPDRVRVSLGADPATSARALDAFRRALDALGGPS